MTEHIAQALTHSCDKARNAVHLSIQSNHVAAKLQALDQAEAEAHHLLEHIRRARWQINTGWTS